MSRGGEKKDKEKKERRDYGGEEGEKMEEEKFKKCMRDGVQGEMTVTQVRRLQTVFKI